VAINHNRKGKGKLVINYSSLDELDGILQHLGVAGEG
jgi:ParB family chromosome partitioning protein